MSQAMQTQRNMGQTFAEFISGRAKGHGSEAFVLNMSTLKQGFLKGYLIT